MIGIIAGEIIGSPFKDENLEGPQDTFVPFEPNRKISITGDGYAASVSETVYHAKAGVITDAVLNSFRPETLELVDKKSLGSALACAIVLGTMDASSNMSREDHDISLNNYLSAFPASHHHQMRLVADASYLLRSGQEHNICKATGLNFQIDDYNNIMGKLRGMFVETDNHEMVLGNGKPNDEYAIEAAVWSISTSFNFEDAVKKAVCLGGNSDVVAAITGGLAELVYKTDNEQFRQNIVSKVEGILSDEQLKQYSEYERMINGFKLARRHNESKVQVSNAEKVNILSFPYVDKDEQTRFFTVYSVPKGRDDIEYAVQQANPNGGIATPEEFEKLIEHVKNNLDEGRREILQQIKQSKGEKIKTSKRVSKKDKLSKQTKESLQNTLDSNTSLVGAAYIQAARPESRVLYFSRLDGKLYNPITLSSEAAFGFRMAGEIDRLRNRTEFNRFREMCIGIRTEQEKSVGLDTSKGHYAFDNAWWLDIERDRVSLMKGHEVYGLFGIDEFGNIKVDTNKIGGTFTSGERLANAMDNQVIFNRFDNVVDVISKIRYKCLDEGFYADQMIRDDEEKTVYDKPEGEERIMSNRELMELDLSNIKGDIPRERPIFSLADIKEHVRILEKNDTQLRYVNSYASDSEVTTLDKAIGQFANKGAVFTAGYGSQTVDEFIENLKLHGIDTVRDIRSYPVSKYAPDFNRDELRERLAENGIKYIYNGYEMGGKVPYLRTLTKENDSVRFTESEGWYKQRTIENAQNSDLTIAFAVDFRTAGEICTAKAAEGKILQYTVNKNDTPRQAANDLFSCLTKEECSKELKINIAGNEISRFMKEGISQNDLNRFITETLGYMVQKGMTISSIVSGGQSGADEAGIIAAKNLRIPAEVHGPSGWFMRDEKGNDFHDEYEFKRRFVELPEREESMRASSYRETMNSDEFRKTFRDIISDAKSGKRQVLMCSESTPMSCHRYACVGYALSHPELIDSDLKAIPVQHIKTDGNLVSQQVLERGLCKRAGVDYGMVNLIPLMEKESVRLHKPYEPKVNFAENKKKSSGIKR